MQHAHHRGVTMLGDAVSAPVGLTDALQIVQCEHQRRIRRLPAYESVPIIALSGNGLAEVVDACQQAGMNDFVGKPFSMDALLEAVTRWLRSSSVG